MKDIYSVFMKKTFKDKSPFEHNIFINNITNQLSNLANLYLFCIPGYICRTQKTMNTFIKEFKNTTNNIPTFFLMPLNVKKNFCNNQSNYDYLNDQTNVKNFNWSFNNNHLLDHSKIIALLNFKEELSDSNYQTQLENDNYEVVFIMLGSTNQSYEAFYKSPAGKGEADVLFIQYEKDENDIDIDKYIKESVERFFLNNKEYIKELDKSLEKDKSITDGQYIISKVIGGNVGDLKTVFKKLYSIK